MLSKCANPQCSAGFYRMGDGKLFAVPNPEVPNPRTHSAKKPNARVEHFWLCSECASTMTIGVDRNRKVVVLHIQSNGRTAAAS